MRSEKGFTLIEIMVALTVTAIAVLYLVQLFSSNLRMIGMSQEYSSALVRAESVLREIAESGQFEEKSWRDESDPRFHVEVAVSESHDEKTDRLPIKLLQIETVFSWGMPSRKKSMTIRTFRIVSRTDNRNTIEQK